MQNWLSKSYAELSKDELFDILQLRQAVFVVEQNCVYPDIDSLDKTSIHLFNYAATESGELKMAAYLRILPAGSHYTEVSFGRVITAPFSRGTGLGQHLISHALQLISEHYPHQAVKISAQLYLLEFYQKFGFTVASEQYMEDGIPHIDMILLSAKG